MGSPIETWDGATAYFTSADAGGVLVIWSAMVLLAVIGALIHTISHEEKSAVVLRKGRRR
jgi:hypothetical protein